MPNILDMGGFGSPGLPARTRLDGTLLVDIPGTTANVIQDFQVNGVSKVKIRKDGSLLLANSASFDFGAKQAGSFTFSVNDGGFHFAVQSAGPSSSLYNFASYAGGSVDLVLVRDNSNILNQRNGTNAQTFRVTRSYTDGSNYSWLTHKWNTTTAVIHAEGAGTGSDGSVAFNDAALATKATVGFVMIPSCAGTPTGVPADIPTGQIPMVWDSTNLKLYVYTGGAWKASAAFT